MRAVHELVERDPELKPVERRWVRAVAAARILFADSDGRNCYPSQDTLARKTDYPERSVRFADRWLVSEALMRQVGRVGYGGSKSYALTVPAHTFAADDDP